jgi:hypothetical protein
LLCHASRGCHSVAITVGDGRESACDVIEPSVSNAIKNGSQAIEAFALCLGHKMSVSRHGNDGRCVPKDPGRRSHVHARGKERPPAFPAIFAALKKLRTPETNAPPWRARCSHIAQR